MYTFVLTKVGVFGTKRLYFYHNRHHSSNTTHTHTHCSFGVLLSERLCAMHADCVVRDTFPAAQFIEITIKSTSTWTNRKGNKHLYPFPVLWLNCDGVEGTGFVCPCILGLNEIGKKSNYFWQKSRLVHFKHLTWAFFVDYTKMQWVRSCCSIPF